MRARRETRRFSTIETESAEKEKDLVVSHLGWL